MAALIKLHRPKGFSDSSKFALNPSTGELLEWEWEHLDPEDFCLDEGGDVFHNGNDKKSWSRIVRHGENANNFFEKKITLFKKVNQKKGDVRAEHPHLNNTSYKGKIRLRKKKYKTKKYKNSQHSTISLYCCVNYYL